MLCFLMCLSLGKPVFLKKAVHNMRKEGEKGMARYRSYIAAGRKSRRNHEHCSHQKNERFLLVTMVQSVLCAMMLAAAFAASQFFGMTELKEAYHSLLSEETQAVEVFSDAWENSGRTQEMGLRLSEAIRQTWEKLRVWLNLEEGGRGGGQALPEHILRGDVVLSARPILPVEGTVTSSYGPREHPINGKADFHTGLDLAAPAGTPIKAALPGVVAEVGCSEIYGNYIRIDHGGFETRYCHCEAVAIQEGWNLRQGETVGWVGSTGWSTGPHLHFELLVDEKAANPVTAAGWVLS